MNWPMSSVSEGTAQQRECVSVALLVGESSCSFGCSFCSSLLASPPLALDFLSLFSFFLNCELIWVMDCSYSQSYFLKSHAGWAAVSWCSKVWAPFYTYLYFLEVFVLFGGFFLVENLPCSLQSDKPVLWQRSKLRESLCKCSFCRLCSSVLVKAAKEPPSKLRGIMYRE